MNSDADSVISLRKQLLANGYTPVPNVGKACYLKNWPQIEVTPEVIEGWSARRSGTTRFKDTGIRVENSLGVIDLDIDDAALMDDLCSRLESEMPELAGALVRYGKGAKEAWFVRTAEPFGRIHTRRWLRPGENIDEHGTHVVEIFGGGSPRQFGAFGAHTRTPSGEIEIEYEWEGGANGSPKETLLTSLPELTKAQFYRIVDIAEEVLASAGWTVVQKTHKGESEASRVYDLTEDMRFESNTGDASLTLDEVEARAGEEGFRVSASFIEPGRNHSLTRCLVGRSHSGQLTIWDSATDITHMRAELSPEKAEQRVIDASVVASRLAKLAQHESEKKTMRRMKVSSEDDVEVAAGKLNQSHGYCPNQQLDVVPLYPSSVSEGMTLTKFRNSYVKNSRTEIGPRGGEKKINPVDIWLSSPDLVIVEGSRMRPDKPRAPYVEDGKVYTNSYTPVVHPLEGGTVDPWSEFLDYILPDRAERVWYERWLAFKYRHPAIPGPAVVMVARQHGTGRGTLAAIKRLLFGARYVKALDFNTFAGKTYQSQYNSWGAESLLVTVNESSDSNGGNLYQGKRDTYERLKDLIEPRPTERHFVRHGLPPFTAFSFTSYFIATQHADALPLPSDDRRFWVGTNGDPIRDVGYWVKLNEWMERPENIGALARHLEELDLADYSPFAPPPMTAGKRAMMEMSASAIDRALDDALAALPGELLIPEQVVEAMRVERDVNSYDFPERWEAIARRQMQGKLYRLGEKDGPGWALKLDGKKFPLYARTQRTANQWAKADPDDRRVEALRNGLPGSSNSIAEALKKLKLVGPQ